MYVNRDLGWVRYCWSLDNECFCRRYETRGGTVKGYLPINRDIKRGLLTKVPRCHA